MVGIKDIASGEFFDIPSDISLEIERSNPYLGSAEEIPGESTLPINMGYTDKNYRLVSYHGNFYKRNSKLSIAVEIHDRGNYKYSGTFVIQAHSSNMNQITDTVWNGIVTFNASSFFQNAKNLLLNEIDMGGERSFPWTTGLPYDGSDGFWQHIHEARAPDAFDYVFYPVINPAWATFLNADEDTKLYLGMNLLGQAEGHTDNDFSLPIGGLGLDERNLYSIVPMIYVKFILQKIFDAIGWTLTGDILEDEGFKRLTLVGTRGIKYMTVPRGSLVINTISPVVFDLKDFVRDAVQLYDQSQKPFWLEIYL